MSIEGLDEILHHRIGERNTIIDTRTTFLVGPGENFGGELLRLEIIVEDTNTKTQKTIHAVAKKIPPTEGLQHNFNVQVTFKSEIEFYKKIVPILQEFQKENGIEDVIDCFVEFYGGRINLNGSDVVDRDGVIVMENLIVSGYKNLDRHKGYTLEETKIVLKDLANLQSTVLAFKLKKPDVFQKEIRPLCCNQLTVSDENVFSEAILVIRDILLESETVVPYVPKVMEIWNKYGGKHGSYEAREPFATLAHCDLWVNNAMMKYENGKPTKNIFLDFQLYSYRSPVFDVLVFLTTSVQTEVIQSEFDNLIEFYHSQFIWNLERLGCDTKPFQFNNFEDELEIDAAVALSWSILFIPFVVFGDKKPPSEEDSGIKEMDFKSEGFLNNLRLMKPECKKRLYFMVETFGRKGWLKV